MELWVRSQDRKRLIKVSYLELEKDDYGFYILGREDKFSGNRLATYKTKERALEVLDEIQNILKPKIIVKSGKPVAETLDGVVYKTPDEVEIKELSVVVYEMPKK